MSIENFLMRWTIRESTTTVIDVKDRLHIDRVGNSSKVKFRCDSTDPVRSKLWHDVKDCKWALNGGPAGHLQGTISDQSGGINSLEITYAENSPNRIRLEFVGMPDSGGEVGTLAGHGGGGGGAGGDDDPT